ncbi:hypothetical protein JOF44_003827 [Brachybacterium fresconis]|uniref:Uncharacterized protein n=1 Tax=Brachybacterium fresconis TaxID=173363 RepID=A0ABS4YQ87_9MICO|nr:hypothetical protein [Brachybacterium fresconis]
MTGSSSSGRSPLRVVSMHLSVRVFEIRRKVSGETWDNSDNVDEMVDKVGVWRKVDRRAPT